MRLIIDTHLDLAWNALAWGRDLTAELEEVNAAESHMNDQPSRGRATVSLPEMRRGGVAVCLATIQARTKADFYPRGGVCRTALDYPRREMASAAGRGQLAYYRLLQHKGQVRMITTAGQLDRHWQSWQSNELSGRPVGFILAMEGADPIVAPGEAESWFRDGLRCVSLAHYGPSAYAVGTGASGPLTEEGIELLEEFQKLGMILDLTHLSRESFAQAVDIYEGPVLASHNNCRSLVPGDRQLADQQIGRLLDRGAVIGVAMDAWMLHPQWQIGGSSREMVDLNAVADQIQHICQLAGSVRHVGIGSDLDGGFGTEQTPHGLDSIADLQKLGQVLSERGFSDDDVDAVFFGNWLRFFRRHLPQ